MLLTKKKKIIVSLCILVVIILGIIGGSVIAKYQSQVIAKGNADVARWVFTLNGTNVSYKTIKIDSSYDESTLVNGKIAPGTQGSFDIIIDATGSEVGVEYAVTFLNEKHKPTNMKFIYDNQEFNSLQELEKNLTGIIDANSSSKKITYTINWRWDYETGETGKIQTNDTIDTNEGTLNQSYSFDVVATGTQVTPKK